MEQNTNTTLKPVRFGDYMIEKHLINEAQLLDVLAEHWMSGLRVGEVVTQKGYAAKDAVERAAEEFASLSTVYV